MVLTASAVLVAGAVLATGGEAAIGDALVSYFYSGVVLKWWIGSLSCVFSGLKVISGKSVATACGPLRNGSPVPGASWGTGVVLTASAGLVAGVVLAKWRRVLRQQLVISWYLIYIPYFIHLNQGLSLCEVNKK